MSSKAKTLAERMIKNTTLNKGNANLIAKSNIYMSQKEVPTDFYIMNIAYSGSLFGGFLDKDLSIFAGPSKHGKTFLTFVNVAAFLNKYKDGVCLFVDSEFGTPMHYLRQIGVDTDRVIHIPVTNLEEAKIELVNQLNLVEKDDKVIIAFDSLSNTPSKKELTDTLNEKSVADMTRAKEAKALFRMVTPLCATKNVPMFVITHTYDSMALFPTKVVSGGCMVKGTKITMEDGTFKEIQDVQVGEKVKTLTGIEEVTHAWNPETLDEGNPECYEVVFEDGHVVTVSDEHKFLVDNEWIMAKDLMFNANCKLHEYDKSLRILAIKPVGKKPVYDISVANAEHYVLENGIVTHNTGAYYSASNIFIMGRQQIKTGNVITGWKFVLNVEKSRSVKEKTKLELEVDENDGINKFSGLIDLACEFGLVVKPSVGWYSKINLDTGEVEDKKYRLSDTHTEEFWKDILAYPEFDEMIKRKFIYNYQSQDVTDKKTK